MRSCLPTGIASSWARVILLLTFVVSALLGTAARPAHADKLKKTIEKLVDLNKKGMDNLDTAEFEAARKAFFGAELLAKRSGLENHPIMARTYVHLGALALLGYKDKPKAADYFARAFAMQPDIELDKSLRLGAVGALFLKVQKQKPAPVSKAPPAPLPPPPPLDAGPKAPAAEEPPASKGRARDSQRDGDSRADSAPTKVGGLECANPDSTPPEQDVTLRCAPPINADIVTVALRYKGADMKAFETVTMEKSAKGWSQGTVPGKRVSGESIKFYFEGLDEDANPVGSSGSAKSPHVMAIAEPKRTPAIKRRADGDDAGTSGETSGIQWTLWVGGGGGVRGIGGNRSAKKNIGAVRVGGAVSFALPTPDSLGDADYELRWGPWLMAETQLDGALGEGGVELALAPIKVARLAYALRLGGGYSKDKVGSVPEVSATLTVGTRSLASSGGSGGDEEEDGEEEGAAKSASSSTSSFANGIRGFFTFRNPPPKSGHGLTFLFGVEITPGLFLPPYTKQRWMGGE